MSLRHCALAIAAFVCATTFVLADDDKGNGKGKQGQRNPEEIFKRLDTSGDGKLSKEEFSKIKDVLQRLGKGDKAGNFLDVMFTRMDENKDGFVSLDEFKKARDGMAKRKKDK